MTSSNLVQLLLRLANELLQRIANHDVTLLRPVLTLRSGGRCVVGERGVGVDVDGCDLLQDVGRADERLKGSIRKKQKQEENAELTTAASRTGLRPLTSTDGSTCKTRIL